MTRREIGDILYKLRIDAGKSREEVADLLGKSVKTVGHWETGYAVPDANTLFLLCTIYGADLNESFGFPTKKAPAVSAEAKNIARIFDSLDAHGKDMVKVVAEREHARMETEAAANTDMEAAPATKTIPLFGASFAAGKGEPDFGNMWEDYEVSVDTKADFAVKINGDSMEPYLHDGSIALGLRQTPKDGDVAALLLDGEFLVKQVCQDMYDNVYLFSLNRKRSDADVTIWHDSGRSLSCFGTIIMEEDVPLPTE